jgi:predicted RNA-binding Zn ribbon-like protein
MPEHHPSTPAHLAALESFLWHDEPVEAAAWAVWVRRHLPHVDAPGGAFPARAARLHAALRQMQAANTGHDDEMAGASQALNGLIDEGGVRPRLRENGELALVAADPGDPASLLLLHVLDAMGSGLWRRFRLCDDPDCRASFFDASKGGGRRWCSMARCGSRSKMRRFRSHG